MLVKFLLSGLAENITGRSEKSQFKPENLRSDFICSVVNGWGNKEGRAHTMRTRPGKERRKRLGGYLDRPAGPAETARDGTGSPESGSLFIIDEPIAAWAALISRKDKGLFL